MDAETFPPGWSLLKPTPANISISRDIYLPQSAISSGVNSYLTQSENPPRALPATKEDLAKFYSSQQPDRPRAIPVQEEQPMYEFPLDSLNQASEKHKMLGAALDAFIANKIVQTPREYHESLTKLLKNQRDSIMEMFDPAKNKSFISDDFLKEVSIDAKKDSSKYNSIASTVDSMIKVLDAPAPNGVSEKDWKFQKARQLETFSKLVNSAMTGTPDAIQNEEAKRINPYMQAKFLDFNNLFSPDKTFLYPQDVDKARRILHDLYNVNVSRANVAYNELARSSNPEYAKQRIGNMLNPISAKGVIEAIPRITRENASAYSPSTVTRSVPSGLAQPTGQNTQVVIPGR